MHVKESFNSPVLRPTNGSTINIPLRGPSEAIIKSLDGFTEVSFALSEQFAELLKLISEDYEGKSSSKALQKYTRKLSNCTFPGTRFTLKAAPIDLKSSLFIYPATDKINRDDAIKSIVIILDVPQQCYAPNFLEEISDYNIYPQSDLQNILRHLPPSVSHININWLAITEWGPVPLSPSPNLIDIIDANNSRNRQSNNVAVNEELVRLRLAFNLLRQEFDLVKQERTALVGESELMKGELKVMQASNEILTACGNQQRAELSATKEKLKYSEKAHDAIKEHAASIEKELELKTKFNAEIVDDLHQTIATHRVELSETRRQLSELKAKSGILNQKLVFTESKLQESEKSTRMYKKISAVNEDLTKTYSDRNEILKEKYLSRKRKHEASLAELLVKNRALEAKNNRIADEKSSTKPRSKKRRTQANDGKESRPALAAGSARLDLPSAGLDGISLEDRYNPNNYIA